MSLKKIYIINLVFGLFVCFAHLPLVIFKLTGASGFELVNLWQVHPIIPFDLVLFFGAIVALVGSDKLKNNILPIHAVILGLFFLLVVGMLFWFIFIGFPKGGFSWSPGLGAATVGYSVYVAKRAFYRGSNKLMSNAGWYSAGIIFLFELLLMYKFYVIKLT